MGRDRRQVLVKHEWHDECTNGYCFRVTSAMAVKFINLKYGSGLARCGAGGRPTRR